MIIRKAIRNIDGVKFRPVACPECGWEGLIELSLDVFVCPECFTKHRSKSSHAYVFYPDNHKVVFDD